MCVSVMYYKNIMYKKKIFENIGEKIQQKLCNMDRKSLNLYAVDSIIL